jgi:sucrose phosphorylase
MRDVGEGGRAPYEINIALYSAFDAELPAYLGAHTLLLAFQGLPGLYIHSLLATPNDLDLVEQTGRTRSINRGHWQIRELEDRLADPGSVQSQVLAHFKRVIACRQDQPALGLEANQTICPTPPGAFIMIRSAPEQTLLVAASVVGESQSVPLDGTGLPQGRFEDRLTGEHVHLQDVLDLAPYQVLWLDITQTDLARRGADGFTSAGP